MEKTYNPQDIEQPLYEHWEKQGYFKPNGDESQESFCIMIPPPNVTGSLHMGHAFQQTIMDTMIRYQRMQGKNTLWQVGTDHAGIATQMVVERKIAAERWRSGKRVLIACEDEKQAYRLDEALWARPAESFVPHNLAGEGPRGGAPVEIAWPQKRSSSPRDILISLRTSFADFATAFTEVVDFVPYEDSLKQLARERYKAYRVAGFNLNTATWK